MATVTLGEIVAAIDGGPSMRAVPWALTGAARSGHAPLHGRFVGIRDDLKLMLADTGLYELATGQKDGKAYPK